MNDANPAAAEKPADGSGFDAEASPSLWRLLGRGSRSPTTDLSAADANASPTLQHPAQQVSWYDASMYCNWLSRREGLKPCYEWNVAKKKSDISLVLIPGSTGYRLLHEAEWEYACRAGTLTEFSSGDDETLLVDYCQMYPSELTSVCGEKLPNAWGLHDTHGNVWEWCWDKQSTSDFLRVVRGGSFFGEERWVRSSRRDCLPPDYRHAHYGFRIAMTLHPVPLIALPPAAGE